MKKYKICAAILSTTILCAGLQVNAVVYDKTAVDVSTGVVEISGKLDTFDEKNALLATVTLENSNFSKDGIIYNNEEVVGEDGSFKIKFKVNNDTVTSGNYLLYLSGEGMEQITEPLEILYYTPKVLTELLKNESQIQPENVTGTEIEKFLSNNEDKFHLNAFPPYSAITKTELALTTADAIKDNSDIISSAEKFIEYIRETSFVIAFNQNKADTAFKSEKEFYIDLSELDAAKNMNCTEIFASELTDAGRANVIAALSGKSIKSIEEWYEIFSLECFINVLSNNSAMGYEYVNKYLLENKFGVDTSEYSALGYKTDAADRYIIANRLRIVDVASLKTVLAEAVVTAKGSGSNGGGIVSSGGGTSSSVSYGQSAIAPEIQAESMFSDLDTVPWAREAILELAKRNILSGKGNGKFDPDGNVTREEFAKLVVNAFNIGNKSDYKTDFSDVAKGAWYESYVNAAALSGIVKGYGDGSFGTGNCITRQDCAVMLFRALEYMGKDTSVQQKVSFDDEGEISDYAKNAVDILSAMNVINGKGNNLFVPKAFCSRAEAAVMFYRLIK